MCCVLNISVIFLFPLATLKARMLTFRAHLHTVIWPKNINEPSYTSQPLVGSSRGTLLYPTIMLNQRWFRGVASYVSNTFSIRSQPVTCPQVFQDCHRRYLSENGSTKTDQDTHLGIAGISGWSGGYTSMSKAQMQKYISISSISTVTHTHILCLYLCW